MSVNVCNGYIHLDFLKKGFENKAEDMESKLHGLLNIPQA